MPGRKPKHSTTLASDTRRKTASAVRVKARKRPVAPSPSVLSGPDWQAGQDQETRDAHVTAPVKSTAKRGRTVKQWVDGDTAPVTAAGKYPTLDLGNPPAEVLAALVEAPSGADLEPKALTKAERRVEAYNLRVAGHNYRDIAEHLKISVKTAYLDVQESAGYLRKYERVIAEDYQAMQLARTDALLAGVWPKAVSGDTFAITSALSIMQRQSKLLGLDAPEEVNVNVRRPLREATAEEVAELAMRLREARPVPTRVLSTSPQLVIDVPVTPEQLRDQEDEDEADDDDRDADRDDYDADEDAG